MPEGQIVSPGEELLPDRLLVTAATTAGDGTFLWGGRLRASVAGRTSADADGVVSVLPRQQSERLPAVGDIVTCRVSRINPRLASVDILCVGNAALRESCSGLIRREDVQPIGVEAVEVYRSFRPGDIVLAKVLSLGDARAYYLTSNEPELGVVLARSAEGARMKPISWCELECPISGARERRKCAKPPALPQPNMSAPAYATVVEDGAPPASKRTRKD
jgi:exosome complex component CSL4